MKIEIEKDIISKGDFINSDVFKEIIQEIETAIASVIWNDDGKFIINPIKKENGVFPIKYEFVKSLVAKGWVAEARMSIVNGVAPGPIDVIKETPFGIFAVEWETGNISSSHRAINKIAVGILEKKIIGGILIIPKRSLAKYLTDRIGNYEEIEPYFPLYNNIAIEDGYMGIFGINYDGTSNDALIIPKGRDGNAPKLLRSKII